MGVSSDQRWMKRALQEAARGVGATSPNPPVGAVIVRDDQEIGSGWHHRAGQPHAEREAIANALAIHGADTLKGATAYVTLEPCSTHGRTPPCTQGLIEHGIMRVVYASTDPNPAHAGGAEKLLAEAGIEVVSGVLEEEADRLIRPFAKVQKTGLPWVIWKTAMSLDGRITRPPGEGMWLTGPDARNEVQKIRSEVDGIITSGETVRRDRPRLDLRDASLLETRDPLWRFILTDKPDSLPYDAPLFTDVHSDRTQTHPRGDLEAFLRSCVADKGINALLLECGGKLAGEFMDAGLIDEVVAFLAPMICGGPTVSLGGKGSADGIHLNEVQYHRFGADLMMRGVVLR